MSLDYLQERLGRRAQREERESARQLEQNSHNLGAMRRLSGEIAHLNREQMEGKVSQLREELDRRNALFESYTRERCGRSMRMREIDEGREPSDTDERERLHSAIENLDRTMKSLEREIATHRLMVQVLTRQVSYSETHQGESPIAVELYHLERAGAPSPRSEEEKAPSALHSEERLPRPIQFSLEEKRALAAIYQSIDLSTALIFHGGKEVTFIRIEGLDRWHVKEVESGRELTVSPESLVSCPRERGEHYGVLLRDRLYREYTLSEISVEDVELPTAPGSNAVIHCHVYQPRSTLGVGMWRLRTLRDAIPGVQELLPFLEQAPNENYYLKLRPRRAQTT